ncbi:MAG: HpcH/HpaI aldolase [Ramlibacter sp.]|uniref:aldolase/citrate lyase family protein n=1 Tax=Ramlibacter sp. TaxID=1917967 RepID=UPI002619AF0C|nr:aldolase/citrate lyase family protein [Ramlibacter sp.]MDB5752798.1 HpcH/HpaI aldolase [Ramlibacter sp.]
MLELIQITNDAAFARRCDAMPGMRLFVDLERLGKAERQAGRNTFISAHQPDDVARVRAAARQSRLMVRVNPLHAGTPRELDAVLAQAPDCVMLPMFTTAAQLREFAGLLAGRAPLVALLETAAALRTLDEWIATPGLQEVFVGLNDLHLSLACGFMFEPLADGTVERVAQACHAQGLRFGFGGIARLDEGLLSGRDVLAEHLRLGSQAVILSRTFHRDDADSVFEQEVAGLRAAEAQLAQRDDGQVQRDAQRIAATIRRIAGELAAGP